MKNSKKIRFIILSAAALFLLGACSRISNRNVQNDSDNTWLNTLENIPSAQVTATMASSNNSNSGDVDGFTGTWISDDTDQVYTMVISGDRITVTWSGDTPWSGNTWTGRITDIEFDSTPELLVWSGTIVNNNGAEVGFIGRINYLGDEIPSWMEEMGGIQIAIYDAEVMIGGSFIAAAEEEVYSVALPAPRRGDVYAVGWLVGESGAVLWINGVAYHLTGDDLYGRADSVFISGSDVYVAGQVRGYSRGAGNWNSAALWKNGVLQYLPGGIMATSVFVSGSDVYVAGFHRISEGYDSAVLWINGVAQHLAVPDGILHPHAEAHSVFVSGGDVYVAGSVSNNAVLWKNGVPQQLPGGPATTVYVSDGDVYVTHSSSSRSGLIKNGEVQFNHGQLQMWEAGPEAHSVFVSGGNVYVAGRNQYYNPVIWVNGNEQRLPGGNVPLSVYVSGGDIYAVGGSLWKNGVVQYDYEDGLAVSVFVVE